MTWEHGVQSNKPDDIGLPVEPVETPEGGKVRGLGTHYTSKEAEALDKELSILRGTIDRAFGREYLRSPIPGLYVVPDKDAARNFLLRLNPDPRLNARAVVYVLQSAEKNTEEVEEWVKLIRNQIKAAPLGRSKEAGKEGLDIIEKLIQCPVLSGETRTRISNLVEQAKLGTVERTEFKRQIAELDITLDVPTVDVGVTVNRGLALSPEPEESVEVLS
jgi:hypothetical protein